MKYFVSFFLLLCLTAAFAAGYQLRGIAGVAVSVAGDNVSCRNCDNVPLTEKLHAGYRYTLERNGSVGEVRITSLNEQSASGVLLTRRR